ncbi:MAG: hypothetical protein WA419_11955 [Silvibacterium sp.]
MARYPATQRSPGPCGTRRRCQWLLDEKEHREEQDAILELVPLVKIVDLGGGEWLAGNGVHRVAGNDLCFGNLATLGQA